MHEAMKKLIPILILLIAVVTLSGCSKDKKCRCTAVTEHPLNTDVTIVSVDPGFSCKKITRIGYERQLEGQLVREVVEVTCEEDKD